MGKKFKLNLSIPEPCTENWENMTPNERGRHCASCNKTVIDFSLFTDKQLIEFFSKATDTICGRIQKFRLERQLVHTESQNHFLHKLLFGSALTIGLAGSANANYNPNEKTLIEQYFNTKENTNKSTHFSGGDSTRYYKGRLLSKDTHQAIQNANVTIEGTRITTTTDSSGNFELPIPKKLDNPLNTILYVHDWGDNYAEVRINLSNVNLKKINTLEIELDSTEKTQGMFRLPSTSEDTIKKNK